MNQAIVINRRVLQGVSKIRQKKKKKSQVIDKFSKHMSRY